MNKSIVSNLISVRKGSRAVVLLDPIAMRPGDPSHSGISNHIVLNNNAVSCRCITARNNVLGIRVYDIIVLERDPPAASRIDQSLSDGVV